MEVRLKFASRALSETLLPLDGVTLNCRYLLPETAAANVVPEKFTELKASVSAAAVKPAPRESVPVFRRVSVVVEAIVVSLPAFPCGSHARITVSTKGAAGAASVAASGDEAVSGETLAAVGSKPKNSRTVSKNARPEFGEALVVTTSVSPITRVNTKVRANVDRDELERLNILRNFGCKRNLTFKARSKSEEIVCELGGITRWIWKSIHYRGYLFLQGRVNEIFRESLLGSFGFSNQGRIFTGPASCTSGIWVEADGFQHPFE